jgi:DNA-binding CsgD family transcriptional regulator
MPDLVASGVMSMLAPYSDRVVIRAGRDGLRGVDLLLLDPTSLYALPAWQELAFGRAAHRSSDVRVVWYGGAPVTAATEDILGSMPVQVGGWLGLQRTSLELVGALERIRSGEIVIDRPGECSVPEVSRSHRLTEREAQVLVLIAHGLSNHQIGDCMHLSMNTIKSYIRSAYRRIGVTSRSQAVLWGVGLGLHRWPEALASGQAHSPEREGWA